MEEINVVRITPDTADMFKSIIPQNVITALKKGKPVTALASVTGNTVIGALCGALEGESFRIISIYVAPSQRRKGAGTTLINSLKELTEDDGYMITAEYSAVSEDEDTLLPFFLSCYFEEDMDDFPYYCKCRLKNFKARPKNTGILFEDIRMLSKFTDNDVKRAGNSELEIPLDIILSENLEKEASFIALEKGLITACCLSERIDEDKILIYSASTNKENTDYRLELLSYTEEALKEKYGADTEILTLVCNPSYEELSNSVFKDNEKVSHRFIF